MHHSRLNHQYIHTLSRYQHKINYINALCLCSVKYMPFPTLHKHICRCGNTVQYEYEHEHNIISLRSGKVATLAMNMYGYVADARNMSHIVWLLKIKNILALAFIQGILTYGCVQIYVCIHMMGGVGVSSRSRRRNIRRRMVWQTWITKNAQNWNVILIICYILHPPWKNLGWRWDGITT